MTDRIMQVIAFLFLAGFLSVLVLFVPRFDLTTVIVITLAASFYDFFIYGRGKPGNPR